MKSLTLNLPFLGKRADTADTGIVSTFTYDAVMTALAAWFIGGLYLDGWAHIHLPSTLETFFTPWHGVLYSAFFASAAFLFATLVRNLARGYALANALPIGYGLSLVGALVFFVGGMGDLIWHLLFGIEVNVEALLSPTHLVLALGGALIVTGPIRAALARKEDSRARLPLLVSFAILYSVFTFFTEYASPFGETLAGISHRPASSDARFHYEALGIAGVLLQAAILVALLLFIARRWSIPFGGVTLMMAMNAGLMTFMHDRFYVTSPLVLFAVAVLAGLVGDLLLVGLHPSPARAFQWRVFAFAQPTILYALYFAALMFYGGGIWWSIHLWAGAILLAGVVGWLVSLAFVVPVKEN